MFPWTVREQAVLGVALPNELRRPRGGLRVIRQRGDLRGPEIHEVGRRPETGPQSVLSWVGIIADAVISFHQLNRSACGRSSVVRLVMITGLPLRLKRRLASAMLEREC
jgi:hypothetical protein